MSAYGPPYPWKPGDISYSPSADLCQSLGGPDGHNAMVRVARYFEMQCAAVNERINQVESPKARRMGPDDVAKARAALRPIGER